MNLVLPVLSFLLWQTSATPGTESTWPADFSAAFSGGGFHQSQSYDGWQAGGGVGANWYLRRPLLDDGTPLSIQAFLQRLDRLSLNVDAVGFDGKNTVSLYEHSGHSANVSLSGLFYFGDMVLGGRIVYARYYDFQHPSPSSELAADERHTTQLAYPELTLGVRLGTFECDASYRFKTYFDDGSVRSPRWGQALFGLRNLADAQVYWSAFLYTLVRGAGLSFDFEFYTSPHLGVWLDGYLERGVVYANDENSYSRKSLSLGVGWWASDRLELQFSVGVSTAQRESAGSTTLITGLGTFGVVVRAPRHYRAQIASPEPVNNE